MALAARIWAKYVPLAIAKAVGPALRKHLQR
jgi:hypothetical protein